MKELFLKSLRLQNYCTYAEHIFNFTRPDGSPYKFICFFGPNGIGKSSLLEAISMLTMDQSNRPMSFITSALQKYVRNADYQPSYGHIKGTKYTEIFETEASNNLPEMLIEGVYEMAGQDYIVRLTQHGWSRNDFSPGVSAGPWGENHLKFRRRITHFITSDKDLSRNNFQLHIEKRDQFQQIIPEIMRYPTHCVDPSEWTDNPSNREYCTDVVISKSSNGIEHRIHFKRMSAGEKKICKSFSDLLNLMHSLEYPKPSDPAMPGWPRILLIDNIVMHVYYDRHVSMVDSIKNVFSGQQIFATTHSGTLIERHLKGECADDEMWVDLEKINT